MKIIKFLFLASLINTSLCSCSSSSALSSLGLIGTTVGAATGIGAGYVIGDQIGKKSENMLLAGAIGAGTGMLVGGLINDSQEEKNAKTRIVRQARQTDARQKEIDALRESLSDGSSWGKLETKSWNERYRGDYYDTPYEGRLR